MEEIRKMKERRKQGQRRKQRKENTHSYIEKLYEDYSRKKERKDSLWGSSQNGQFFSLSLVIVYA